jgi:DNA-binding NtrC family response regulator
MLFQHTINILLIEDEVYDARRVEKTLEPFGDRLKIKKVVADGQSALDALSAGKNGYDVIIMDYQIVGGVSGETLIRKMREIDDTLQIIVITKMTINISDFDFANRLLEAGAIWYCTKYPGDIEDYIYQPTDFVLSILNAYEKRRLEKERKKSTKKLSQTIEDILAHKQIIGDTPVINELREQIRRLSNVDSTALISGESGTGKELVATHIHYTSKRRFEKMVVINCGSLPQDLIESELFGFEKGSFTGAHAHKPGLFEVAHRGAVFLDEVGELPLSAQVKLLRVLQDGEIDKIGRTEKMKVDVRIIAATNTDLEQAVKDKKFREDLYYRLNVVTLRVPPLRERRPDILHFFDHFLEKFASQFNLPVPDISDEARDFIVRFDWPGNVRQVQNMIHRLLIMNDGKIELNQVKQALGLLTEKAAATAGASLHDFWKSETISPWREVEKKLKYEYFRFVRENTSSDAEAARRLGLAPPNYYRMCKEIGLKKVKED